MGVIVTDDFNRVDAASLGANWTDTSAQWAVTSNQARSVNTAVALFTGASWTGGSDHYAEAQYVTTAMASNDYTGPIVRGTEPGGPTLTAYQTAVDGTNLILYKSIANALTSLGTVVGGALTDTLRCEVSGTTIRSLLNGVVKSTVTDAAIASGKPGLACSVLTVAAAVLDTFAAGDLSGTIRPLRALHGLVSQQRML